MIFWLPRPYPDEIVGSTLARASRFMGLSPTYLVRSATGLCGCDASFVLPGGLVRMADLMGFSGDLLLEQHTIFPYVVAFTPAALRAGQAAKVFQSSGPGQSLAGLTNSFTNSTWFRRYCTDCAREDEDRFGETYWHRAHLLPGVHVCTRHRQALRAVMIPLNRGGASMDSVLPRDVPSRCCPNSLNAELTYRFAQASEYTLRNYRDPQNLSLRYHARALVLGYGFGHMGVASEAFNAEFRSFFGQQFLAELGCNFELDRRRAWPAMMLRPHRPSLLTAVKHILIQIFLASAPVADPARFGYNRALATGGRFGGPNRRRGSRERFIGTTIGRTISTG